MLYSNKHLPAWVLSSVNVSEEGYSAENSFLDSLDTGLTKLSCFCNDAIEHGMWYSCVNILGEIREEDGSCFPPSCYLGSEFTIYGFPGDDEDVYI